jgi:putative endopeptidase
MNAYDINAYYSPTMNEIVFPAGILQELFYSSTQSLAENLGGIGAVIGHEMTHGFDDKGRLYDLNGNLNDWWTEDDAKNFELRSKKLEEQFNSYGFFGSLIGSSTVFNSDRFLIKALGAIASGFFFINFGNFCVDDIYI